MVYDKLLFHERLILTGSKVIRRHGCASEQLTGGDTKMGSSQMHECYKVRPWSRVEMVKMFVETEVHYRDHISPPRVSIF